MQELHQQSSREILPPGDIWQRLRTLFDGHNQALGCYCCQWTDAREAAEHPTRHRTAPRAEKDPITNVDCVEAEKPALDQRVPHLVTQQNL